MVGSRIEDIRQFLTRISCSFSLYCLGFITLAQGCGNDRISDPCYHTRKTQLAEGQSGVRCLATSDSWMHRIPSEQLRCL